MWNTKNNALFGIFTMCAGVFCLATMDAVAKWLGQYYPITQLVFFRNLFAIPAIFILAMSTGGLHRLKPVSVWMHLIRGILGFIALACFFLALRFMPLASAWTIAFAGPIITTALSPLIVKERVGPWRWLAVAVGFVGVLIMMRPGGGTLQWAALLPLGTAVSFSLVLLLARRYAESEDFAAMVAFTIVVPLLITGGAMPFVWVEPAPVHWPAFFTLGVLGGASITFMTLAYRIAAASVVTPFDYTALIWSVLWGWVIWGEWPDKTTWLGAVIIVGSGAFILYRETAVRSRDEEEVETRAEETALEA